ncbi:hypothetical protein AJ79_03368 [Helicocarpus griseus UAMH5409]|uniref:Protein PBN1 n=1 Tax=Helicocarpus griseus UAMH5409 TaxID=1447875 RepID=A0A2B7XYU8_9EURO|nr:hypothetical protein AJ79_03368 [Helicocarpus griseus UAMH5409]
MRQRITYIHEAQGKFDPDQLTLTDNSLSVRSLHAAREERATFGFKELPQELWQVLKQCHELHIRWSSHHTYDAVPPFASRVSPGLHVFYTPAVKGRSATLLCPLLRKVFDDGLKCEVPETSFISPPILSTRFASTSSLQFHQLLPSLAELVTYIQQKICPLLGDADTDKACIAHATSILTADSVDIDYDSISHALTVSGYWSQHPQDRWSETIRKREENAGKVEVGVLAMERARLAEELSVGGFLAVVGEDKKLQPTLFSFPARHHPLPETSTYAISFPPPTGLHPTLHLSIPRTAIIGPPSTAPPSSSCALHTYLTLPSPLFADKHQLSTSDPLFLSSHNLVALRAIAGETDLEAPDWVTERWGSNLLLELATPSPSNNDVANHEENWQITIPLHLRYLPPSPTGYRNISVTWPIVFWACTAEEGTKMGINPFDRVGMGWEGLFGARTMFYQLTPDVSGKVGVDGEGKERGVMIEQIEVPVLKLREGGEGSGSGLWGGRKGIEMGTVIVVVLGFLWVLGKLAGVVRTGGVGKGQDGEREKKE